MVANVDTFYYTIFLGVYPILTWTSFWSDYYFAFSFALAASVSCPSLPVSTCIWLILSTILSPPSTEFDFWDKLSWLLGMLWTSLRDRIGLEVPRSAQFLCGVYGESREFVNRLTSFCEFEFRGGTFLLLFLTNSRMSFASAWSRVIQELLVLFFLFLSFTFGSKFVSTRCSFRISSFSSLIMLGLIYSELLVDGFERLPATSLDAALCMRATSWS